MPISTVSQKGLDAPLTLTAPVFSGNVTATTITSPAATALTLQSAGTTAVTVNTSQNVGIGTASPSTKLQVTKTGSSSVLTISSDTTNSGLAITDGTINGVLYSSGVGGVALYATSAHPVVFGTSNTERMRIDTGGNLLVGTTTNYGSAKTHINSAGTVLSLYCSGGSGQPALIIGKESNDASTSQVLMQFLYNSGSLGLGQINGNGGGSAAFGSYSDIRLKENITNIDSQLGNICALRPVEFDYKTGGHQIGFIAQEMQEIYPDAVGTSADDMLTITGWSKTEARLVKAIQELKATVDAQAARIAALEAK